MAHQFPTGMAPGFSIDVTGEGTQRQIICSGTLDTRDATVVVQSELLRFHDTLIGEKVSEILLDMRGIDYMNSSGIKAFLTWFLKAEVERRYKIDLTYNPQRSWQSVSFTAMARIAQTVLRLKPAEPASA